MSKRKILLQLDSDRHPSVFDRVVAIDAGVDELFSYGGVKPDEVEALVHGAMFTRGPADLHQTAIFVGGHNVAVAEEIVGVVARTFFGPLRCSVMMDASGANTTAAAAVMACARHVDLQHTKALVLAGTGPVGQRLALLLVRQGAAVWVGSRSKDRAEDVCAAISERIDGAHVYPAAISDAESVLRHPERFQVLLAAGAVGTRLLHRSQIEQQSELRVLIDLNAVPPTGLEGVEPADKGRQVGSIFQYGALGVGGLKMKIHRAAVARLFEANDLVLDAETIFDLGQKLNLA